MPENKTQPTSEDVQDFLNGVADQKRRADSVELLTIMKHATSEEPVMWGSAIIGFGSYHYKYESGREGDAPKIGFSPRKAALVLYGVIYYDKNLEMAKELGPHTLGKGCLYIKDLSKINKDVLRKLIAQAYRQ